MKKPIEELTYKEKLSIAGVKFITIEKHDKLNRPYKSHYFEYDGKTIEACDLTYDVTSERPGCSLYYYIKKHFGIDNKILLH